MNRQPTTYNLLLHFHNTYALAEMMASNGRDKAIIEGKKHVAIDHNSISHSG
jgi:hypothetical protein